jgi:hypothetical protein
VVELDQDHVVDEVLDPGPHHEKRRGRWDECPVHERPSVVGEACLRAGHQPAQGDLQEDQGRESLGSTAPEALFKHSVRALPQAGRHPDEAGQDEAGDRQMQGELDRGDGGHAGLQPGGHHDPSHGGLETAQGPDGQEGQGQPPPDDPSGPEPDQGQEEDEAEQAAELPVPPFPAVDDLELG